MTSVVTIGETMGLLVNEKPGRFAHTNELRLSIGGAESNVAIGLRRLGVDVAWIGRVGTDGIGELVLRELAAEGVEVHGGPGPGSTGVMFKERRTAHASSVTYYRARSAGSRLSADDIDAELIARADLLHVTGITPALSDTAEEAVSAAIRIARASGVTVSFDVNHRNSLWLDRDAPSVYRSLARQSDILFAGEDEARLIAPAATSLHDVARAIADLGPTQVLIKLGARGCSALIDGVALTAPAVAVDVVDTVGAGDAFVAGYLAELLEGCDAAQRIATATTVGAFTCLSTGDWEGMPRRDELELLSRSEGIIR